MLRHRAAAAACACLTVDAAEAAAYCTPESEARLGKQMVFCTTIAQIQVVLQKVFFLTWFSITVDYRSFLTENYFFLPCVLPFVRSYSVVDFD